MKTWWDELVGFAKYSWNHHILVANQLRLLWLSHTGRVSGNPRRSGLDYHIYTAIAEVPAQAWTACNVKQDVFLSLEYLTALEQASPANMRFRYAVFSVQGRPVAIGYFQILELNARLHGSASRFSRSGVKGHLGAIHDTLVNHATHRILVCGNALLSGEHGYAVNGADEAQVLHGMVEAGWAIRAKSPDPIHVTVIKDFYDGTSERAQVAERFGFHTFDAGPNLVLALRPQWNAFDDYLNAMRPKYRKQAAGVLKKGQTLQRRSLDAEELDRRKEELYRLYGQVVDQSKFKLFFLSPDYLAALKRHLGDRFECEAYFAGETLIGFTTRIYNGAEMEGYTHGLDYSQGKPYELYQNFMLSDVRAALAARCSRINTGRTSAAMKSGLGAEPRGMRCYLRFSGRVMNHFSRPLWYFVRPAGEYCRHPFEDNARPAPSCLD